MYTYAMISKSLMKIICPFNSVSHILPPPPEASLYCVDYRLTTWQKKQLLRISEERQDNLVCCSMGEGKDAILRSGNFLGSHP